jgi:hypothetical protein
MHIRSRNLWTIVYVHTGCNKGKGALKVFKEQYLTFEDDQKKKIVKAIILQPNMVLKLRIFIKATLCMEKEGKGLVVQKHNK